MDDHDNSSNTTNGRETPNGSGRGSRGIRFPYGDLNDAVEVASAVFQHGGGSCELADLAAPMDTTTTSSTFRTKVATAKTFGVLSNQRGVAALTDLGRRIADPVSEDAARAEAFLHVPLYNRLYEDYAGKLLPGDSGLEAEMERLGVPEKSSSRARQVFQRSAAQAGFFSHGRNRLTKPAAATVNGDQGDDAGDQNDEDDKVEDGQDNPDMAPAMNHPLLAGVLAQLPAPGSEFTPTQQGEWLELMDRALKWVYGTDERKRGEAQHAKGQTAG